MPPSGTTSARTRSTRNATIKPGLAEVCDSLANLLLRRGKAAYGLTFARQSLELKDALHDRFGAAISHGTAGRALVLLARYDEAAEEFRPRPGDRSRDR